jgi:hypothetical protein
LPPPKFFASSTFLAASSAALVASALLAFVFLAELAEGIGLALVHLRRSLRRHCGLEITWKLTYLAFC